MQTASLPVRPAGFFRSRRLLGLARDETLARQVQLGNDAAFEAVFERYGAGVLGFCRHMLGSTEEAEDAVQQTFASAFRDLRRAGERELALKPWLYAIARNRCLSMLRSRRDHVHLDADVATRGLAEEVEQRAELRDLLTDLRKLPGDQRAALLLTELGALSHADVGRVLGCEPAKVKGLVFRARTGLIQRRQARETPCAEIRRQLATLRGGSLRRSELRHHLHDCPGCRDYRTQIAEQRKMLATALPVVPSAGLKSAVVAAVGWGSGSSGGGLAASLGGLGTALSSPLATGTTAKVAAVGLLATGGAVVGTSVDHAPPPRPAPQVEAAPASPARAPARPAGRASSPAPRRTAPPAGTGAGLEPKPPARAVQPRRPATEPALGAGREGLARGRPAKGPPAHGAPGVDRANQASRTGAQPKPQARQRGPVTAPPPPPPAVPVKRGPPAPKPAPPAKLKPTPPAKLKPAPPGHAVAPGQQRGAAPAQPQKPAKAPKG